MAIVCLALPPAPDSMTYRGSCTTHNRIEQPGFKGFYATAAMYCQLTNMVLTITCICTIIVMMQGNIDQRLELTQSLRTIRRAMWREMLLGMMGHLGTQDLSFTQFATLLFLETEGEASVTDVAAALDRSLATTSRLVDGLVQRGFVHRQEDSSDRRVRRVSLSAAGHALITSMEQVRVDAQLAAMAVLTPAERADVARAMHLLAGAVSRRFEHAQLTTDDRDGEQRTTTVTGAE